MEYYSVIKRNKVLIHAKTLLDLWKHYGKGKKPITKDHMYDFIYMKLHLRERRQTQNNILHDNIYMKFLKNPEV